MRMYRITNCIITALKTKYFILTTTTSTVFNVILATHNGKN